MWGCTLAHPDEYDWTIHVQRWCGLLSNYFDHLSVIGTNYQVSENDSCAHDDQGDNHGQAAEGSMVSSVQGKIAGILISTVKVLAAPTSAEADRCSWIRWLTLNNRRQSVGAKLDSRQRLEGVHYQVLDKAAHAYSAFPYPSVTCTLTHIINQTSSLPGLAQWACLLKGFSAWVQSRLDPCLKEQNRTEWYLLCDANSIWW